MSRPEHARGSIGRNTYDVYEVRKQFPALWQEVHGHPLVYLDNGATSQKPQAVIDAVRHYYERDNANVHRGVHTLSERATEAYEGARVIVQRFLNAAESREIVYTRGTTESINLVAQSYARPRLREGDEILFTTMEHHSNIVPWQMVAAQTGALARAIPIHDDGSLDLDAYRAMLGPRTRVVALTHLANSLGTVNPVTEITAAGHEHGAVVVVDGAQAVPHLPVDVRVLGADFYAFSGHKVFGPTGIGILWGRADLLEAMDPWQGGGDMIRTVTLEESTWNDLPYKFEAGTPNIAGAVGLGVALEYVRALGVDAIGAHEHDLLEYATAAVGEIEGLRLVGTAPEKSGIVSFVMDGVHAHDVGTVLDRQGVAIRTGHHCTMPVMQRFGVAATSRASLALYNTREDVDALVRALAKVEEIFG